MINGVPMDAASLAAMETFLREYEAAAEVDQDTSFCALGDSGTSGDGSSSGGSPSSRDDIDQVRRREIQNAMAAQRRLRYINKVKAERVALKQQEQALSAQLRDLQQAQTVAKAKVVENVALGAWKAVTIRQRESRLEAEERSRKLRLIVSHQAKVIREMKDLLLKVTRVPHCPITPSAGHSLTLFRAFARELNALHGMTDQVCSGANFKPSPSPLKFGLTREWNQTMTFLESADSTIIPFGPKTSSSAMTSLMLHDPRGDRVEVDGSENTRAMKHHFDYSRELGESATVTSHSVVRRYVEADRVVFVWRALTEGRGDFEGLYTDETAWYVLRPSAAQDEAMIVGLHPTRTRWLRAARQRRARQSLRGDFSAGGRGRRQRHDSGARRHASRPVGRGLYPMHCSPSCNAMLPAFPMCCTQGRHQRPNGDLGCLTSMPADEEPMDAASLAALAVLTEFLRECETPVDADARVGPQFDEHHPVLAETVDADEASESTVSSLSLSPSAAERRRKLKNAQAAKRRLRYLKKLKVERKTLKKQEVDLSAQLKELQQAHAKERTARNKKTLALSAWRATATRQKERRTEAEEKQRQLKMAVVNQSALIHRMNHLVQQQRLLNSSEHQAASRDRKGKALLQTFVREMDALYAKTDDVIGKVDFGMSPPLTYELTRKWSKDKSFLESADATVIPFSFEQTCRAVSLMILAPSYNDELDDPDNTAIRTYRLNFSRELGNSATLVVYNAVKRYVEKDRAVFVWRALAEGQGEFDGLHTVETAWFVVRPLTAAEAGETEARHTKGSSAMILESYTRLVPVGFGRPSDNDTRANKFIKILAKADEADVNDMKQMLGKLLLDEARANPLVNN